MPENIRGQQARLDNLDGKIDKKISVVEGKEEELTGVYIDKVDELVASLSILPGDQKEEVKEAVITSLKGINAANIEEKRAGFDQSINSWLAKIEGQFLKRMEAEEAIQEAKVMEGSNTLEKLQKEAFDKSMPMKTKKSAQEKIASLKKLREEVGDDETLTASIDGIIMLLEVTVEELDGLIKKHGLDPLSTDFSILKKTVEIKALEEAGGKYEKYTEIVQKIEEYTGSEELSQRAVDENGVGHLQGYIDAEMGKIDGWITDLKGIQGAFDAITYTVAFGMDTEGNEIAFLNEFPKNDLTTLQTSGEYFAVRNKFLLDCAIKQPEEITEGSLIKYHQEIEKRTIDGNGILSDDSTDVLNSIKQELVGRKTEEIKDVITQDVEEFIGNEYVEIKHTPGGGMQVSYTEAFKELPAGEQMIIQNEIRKMGVGVTLKAEEALLQVESREHMILFYEANQKLSGGDLMGAKKIYLQALASLKKVCAGGEEKPEEAIALKKVKGNLKQIALVEVGRASGKIGNLEASINNTSAGWTYGMAEGKLGASKVSAKQMVKAQKAVLELMKKIIGADNDVHTYEDALKIMENLDYSKMDSVLSSLGLTYSVIQKAEGAFGHWDSHGISYWQSKFGTDHQFEGKTYSVKGVTYRAQLDALTAIAVEGGRHDPVFLKAKADEYKKDGLYDMAEATYNLYFKELYKQEATGGMSLELFLKNYKKKDVDEEIAAFEEEFEETEGRVLSPQEKKRMKTDIIKRKWENALKLKITNKANAGQIGEPEASEWLEYNDDILQVDRAIYEFWEMNCKEWDDFIEFLPADIAFTLMTAGGAHLTGKLVTKAIGKKLLTKELAKLGIREAFKKGGAQMAKTALMTSAKRLTPKMVGFLAESVAFAEFGMAAQAIRSGDISDITSLDAHMSAVGHSILTLGTIKGVSGGLSMLGTKSLLSKGVAGKIAHHGITTTVDAIALTGVGVGIATMGEGYVSQEELTTMIATGLRDNIALSVGIHAGQGLAKLSLKSAKVAKTMKEQGRFKISKKELASLFTLAGEEAMLGHEFMKNEGASKPTEKMSIDIAEKSTSAKAEAKGERAGIDGNDDEGEETKEGIAQITKEKPFYSWEEDSVDGKV